jgi:hypothetical protein
MKTVGENYIDYSGTDYAVRVWQGSCHPLRRENEKWITFDNLYALPIARELIQSGHLAEILRDYQNSPPADPGEDKRELERLLRGEITFAIAFNRATRSHSA